MKFYWKKEPGIRAGELHIGCATCSTAEYIAPLDMVVAVGFGEAYVTVDGELFYDADEFLKGDLWLTVRHCERAALNDPNHDWRIVRFGALHGETYQRQGKNKWVCIESNEGFA